MAYYRVCSNCGCNIDPGEICDCRVEKRKEVAPLTRKRPLANYKSQSYQYHTAKSRRQED